MIIGKNSWKCLVVFGIWLLIAAGTLIMAGTSVYKAGIYLGVANFLIQCFLIRWFYKKWENL